MTPTFNERNVVRARKGKAAVAFGKLSAVILLLSPAAMMLFQGLEDSPGAMRPGSKNVPAAQSPYSDQLVPGYTPVKRSGN